VKLEGIKVVDLSAFLPGPHLTMMMADHGADVIRIEPPTGEPNRQIGLRQAGTTVYFHPDPTIFPKIDFDPALIRERLEVVSYIHKGVKVTFENETDGTKDVFQHQEGLAEYVAKIVAERSARPVHETAFAVERES